jgi:hypothetical protein
VQVRLEEDGVLDADRARHQVLVRRERRLLGGDEARVDLLLQERVVVRDLHQPARALPIAARVADVAEQEPVLAEDADDERRPHAGVLRVRVRGVEDRRLALSTQMSIARRTSVSVADSDASASQRPSSVLMNDVHMPLATSPAL